MVPSGCSMKNPWAESFQFPLGQVASFIPAAIISVFGRLDIDVTPPSDSMSSTYETVPFSEMWITFIGATPKKFILSPSYRSESVVFSEVDQLFELCDILIDAF